VRIDDLDTPRVVPGSEEAIVATLQTYGLFDAATPLLRQSDRLPHYHEALRTLTRAGLVFRCRCSRRQLAGHAVYPGTCRARRLAPEQLDARLSGAVAADGVANEEALRVRLHGTLQVHDAVQGERRVVLERDVGDTVVLRRDGVIAWPLATACDDTEPVTEVVRGADLFDPTPAQIALIERLGRRAPRYAHVPVLCDAAQRKLGKQTRAPALPDERALSLLQAAWAFLGQTPIRADGVAAFHALTPSRWSVARVPAAARRHDPRLAG